MRLADRTATYRDWSAVEVCFAPPKTLRSDLESMNALLANFLATTSAGKDGVWSDEQLASLEDAPKLLTPALAAHRASVAAAQKCTYPKDAELAEPLSQGDELGRQAASRLEEAPALFAELSAKRALKRWMETQESERTSMQQQFCPAKVRPGSAEVFYARENTQGVLEWYLCDGSKVVLQPGGKHEYQPTAQAKRARRPVKVFIDAANRFPASEIRRAPKVPEATVTPAPQGES